MILTFFRMRQRKRKYANQKCIYWYLLLLDNNVCPICHHLRYNYTVECDDALLDTWMETTIDTGGAWLYGLHLLWQSRKNYVVPGKMHFAVKVYFIYL